MKVARQHAAESAEAYRSLQREARIGGLLAHPNLLAVADVGNIDGQPYLVLDYVEGGSLGELLSGPQPPHPALTIAVLLDVLRGLAYVHETADAEGRPLGIVHRDVSPNNILVGIDGVARLTDFGAAWMADDDPGGLHGGSPSPILGKPGYLAPEQLYGAPVDARTDVFAAGIVLWTALTGTKLFTDETYESTILNILTKRIPAPSSYGAPACLDDICFKALTRSPDGRFQTAEEMRLALHRAASANGFLASSTQVIEWVRRSVGETLDERRRRIQRAFDGYAEEPSARVVATNEPGGRSVAVAPRPRLPTPPANDAQVLTPADPHARSRTQRRRAIITIGITAAVTAALGLLSMSQKQRARALRRQPPSPVTPRERRGEAGPKPPPFTIEVRTLGPPATPRANPP